jgi:hypothetical protein
MEVIEPSTGGGPSTWKEARPAESQTPDDGDRLRHIICVSCFPAFAGTQEAPHDAMCICGKPVTRGDRRSPDNSAQCIICNELLSHHTATAHR